MNERIKGLYQEHILKKSKDDTFKGALQNETHYLEAYKPMCGDKYTISMSIVNDVIQDARFEGFGCAISKASTALLTEIVIGKSVEEIKPIVENFLELVDEHGKRDPESIFNDDQLLAFAAAREFPERKTCASLSWTELKTLIDTH